VSILIQDDLPTQTRAASPHLPSNARGTLGQTDSPSPASLTQKTDPQSTPGRVGQQVALLAPEIAPPTSNAPEAARLTANPRPVSPSVAIAAAIEQLRRNDSRYQQIRARVQDTTVYIMPGETATEDAMTFAQTVRRVPGVQHVIMDASSR
jgi:hypothetical protein